MFYLNNQVIILRLLHIFISGVFSLYLTYCIINSTELFIYNIVKIVPFLGFLSLGFRIETIKNDYTIEENVQVLFSRSLIVLCLLTTAIILIHIFLTVEYIGLILILHTCSLVSCSVIEPYFHIHKDEKKFIDTFKIITTSGYLFFLFTNINELIIYINSFIFLIFLNLYIFIKNFSKIKLLYINKKIFKNTPHNISINTIELFQLSILIIFLSHKINSEIIVALYLRTSSFVLRFINSFYEFTLKYLKKLDLYPKKYLLFKFIFLSAICSTPFWVINYIYIYIIEIYVSLSLIILISLLFLCTVLRVFMSNYFLYVKENYTNYYKLQLLIFLLIILIFSFY